MCISGACLLAQSAASGGQGARGPFGKDRVSDSQRALLDETLLVTVHMAAAPTGNSVPVSVDLLNISSKTITAFAFTVVARYADGTEANAWKSLDILGGTIFKSEPGTLRSGGGTLRSSETLHSSVLLRLGSRGSLPTFAAGRATTVLWDDRTALGDAEEIQRILDHRRDLGTQLRAVVADLRAAQADPGVRSAGNGPERAARLSALVADQMSRARDKAPDPGAARRLELLKPFSDVLADGVDFVFDRMLADQEAFQRAMIEHSTLAVSK
jgi:hypothetical protein